MVIPRSWLKPELAVHRSAFALITTDPFDGAVKGTVGSVAGPRSVHVDPLLLVRMNWLTLDAVATATLGTSCTVRRVGEKSGPIGPAPAKMVAPVANLLVFHWALTVYVVPASSGRTV